MFTDRRASDPRQTYRDATCRYDSGAATDCQPLCSDRATVLLQYLVACYGWFEMPLCRRHLSPMRGRVYPDTVETVAL